MDVVVIIGSGGMGEAIARRVGSGKRLLIADFNEELLDRVQAALSGDGFDVVTQQVDVSVRESVSKLADYAASLGNVVNVVHTAGLSPVQAPTEAILKVDLLGVAISLDEFGRVIAPGGAGVVIASMAGSMSAGQFPAEMETALALTPTDELLALPFLSSEANLSPGAAYGISKRANQLRVQSASLAWGEKQARINTISPGVISTPMGQEELSGESGEGMRQMIAGSGTGRVGTPNDIAAAASFLLGSESSFITGTDLLVDGGVVAAVKSGKVSVG